MFLRIEYKAYLYMKNASDNIIDNMYIIYIKELSQIYQKSIGI